MRSISVLRGGWSKLERREGAVIVHIKRERTGGNWIDETKTWEKGMVQDIVITVFGNHSVSSQEHDQLVNQSVILCLIDGSFVFRKTEHKIIVVDLYCMASQEFLDCSTHDHLWQTAPSKWARSLICCQSEAVPKLKPHNFLGTCKIADRKKNNYHKNTPPAPWVWSMYVLHSHPLFPTILKVHGPF